jgi:hypothetical protein
VNRFALPTASPCVPDGRIYTQSSVPNVAAGILAAVEPGILPGGVDVGRAGGAEPGGRMPPSTAARMPAATWWCQSDAPAPDSQAGSRMGIERRRMPVAWKTALPIAGAMAMIGVSPAPAESWSGRLRRWMSSSGTSAKRGT